MKKPENIDLHDNFMDISHHASLEYSKTLTALSMFSMHYFQSLL
jgi:hypothetical protein